MKTKTIPAIHHRLLALAAVLLALTPGRAATFRRGQRHLQSGDDVQFAAGGL